MMSGIVTHPINNMPTLINDPNEIPLTRLPGSDGRAGPGSLGVISSMRHLAQRCQARSFQLVPVEEVVRIERNQSFPVGVGDVDAGLLYRSNIEGIGVKKLHDDDAKYVCIAEC